MFSRHPGGWSGSKVSQTDPFPDLTVPTPKGKEQIPNQLDKYTIIIHNLGYEREGQRVYESV